MFDTNVIQNKIPFIFWFNYGFNFFNLKRQCRTAFSEKGLKRGKGKQKIRFYSKTLLFSFSRFKCIVFPYIVITVSSALNGRRTRCRPNGGLIAYGYLKNNTCNDLEYRLDLFTEIYKHIFIVTQKQILFLKIIQKIKSICTHDRTVDCKSFDNKIMCTFESCYN